METIYFKGDIIRLGQALKLSGYAENGGIAKAMIQDGIVFVNGTPEIRRGRQLSSGDIVSINFEDEKVSFTVVKQ